MSRTKAHRSSLVLGGFQLHDAAAGPAGTLRVSRREREELKKEKKKMEREEWLWGSDRAWTDEGFTLASRIDDDNDDDYLFIMIITIVVVRSIEQVVI